MHQLTWYKPLLLCSINIRRAAHSAADYRVYLAISRVSQLPRSICKKDEGTELVCMQKHTISKQEISLCSSAGARYNPTTYARKQVSKLLNLGTGKLMQHTRLQPPLLFVLSLFVRELLLLSCGLTLLLLHICTGQITARHDTILQ
jgi:hypothetical protein